jgi:hypothetical protein
MLSHAQPSTTFGSAANQDPLERLRGQGRWLANSVPRFRGGSVLDRLNACRLLQTRGKQPMTTKTATGRRVVTGRQPCASPMYQTLPKRAIGASLLADVLDVLDFFRRATCGQWPLIMSTLARFKVVELKSQPSPPFNLFFFHTHFLPVLLGLWKACATERRGPESQRLTCGRRPCASCGSDFAKTIPLFPLARPFHDTAS